MSDVEAINLGYVRVPPFWADIEFGNTTNMSNNFGLDANTSSVVHATQAPSMLSNVEMSEIPMLYKGRSRAFDGSNLGMKLATDLDIDERMEML